MRKRSLIILILCFFTFFLAGCNSFAELIITEDENTTYFELRLSFDDADLLKLNDNAKENTEFPKTDYNPFDPNLVTDGEFDKENPWTVERYIKFLSLYADTDGFTYLRTDPVTVDGSTVMVFKDELPKINKPAKTIKSNPFTRTLEAEFANPFKSWFDGYGEPVLGTFFDVFNNGKMEIWTPSTNIAEGIDESVIFDMRDEGNWSENPDHPPVDDNGEIKYYFEKRIMYSFNETFNTKLDLKDAPVTVKWATVSRFNDFGYDKKEKDAGGYNVYSFVSDFSAADTITVRYTRPNAYGWYLLSIILGVLTVLTVVLVAKKKGKKKNPDGVKSLETFNDPDNLGK